MQSEFKIIVGCKFSIYFAGYPEDPAIPPCFMKDLLLYSDLASAQKECSSANAAYSTQANATPQHLPYGAYPVYLYADASVDLLPPPPSVSSRQNLIYQYQTANGSWLDQDKESYDYNVKMGQAVVRVVSTVIMPPAQLVRESRTPPPENTLLKDCNSGVQIIYRSAVDTVIAPSN